MFTPKEDQLSRPSDAEPHREGRRPAPRRRGNRTIGMMTEEETLFSDANWITFQDLVKTPSVDWLIKVADQLKLLEEEVEHQKNAVIHTVTLDSDDEEEEEGQQEEEEENENVSMANKEEKMVRGLAEFSSAETDYLVGRVLDSELSKIEANRRTSDANRMRQGVWEAIRDDFNRNFSSAGCKKTFSVVQLQSRYKYIYQNARKKHGELRRYRNATGAEQDADLEARIMLSDGEERIIATYGRTPSFCGIPGGQQSSVGGLNEAELLRACFQQESQKDDDCVILTKEADDSENPTPSDAVQRRRDLMENERIQRVLQTTDFQYSESNDSDSDEGVHPKRRRQEADAAIKLLSDIRNELIQNRELMQRQTEVMCSLLDAVRGQRVGAVGNSRARPLTIDIFDAMPADDNLARSSS